MFDGRSYIYTLAIPIRLTVLFFTFPSYSNEDKGMKLTIVFIFLFINLY